MRLSERVRKAGAGLAVALFVLPSLACGSIDLPVTLALEDPSAITIEIPIFPPPDDMETTTLVGGVETNISADVGILTLLGLLVGQALPADITVNDIAIAGTELVIGGFLPTGTICVALDEADPGGGMAYLNVLLGMAAFQLDLNSVIYLTNPVVAPILGGPLPFQASIDTMAPLKLSDLLGLLAGGSGGLSLTQTIDTNLPPDTPVIGPAGISATLTLSSADALPSDLLLDECAAFLADL